jgi:hypothetical protein
MIRGYNSLNIPIKDMASLILSIFGRDVLLYLELNRDEKYRFKSVEELASKPHDSK